MTTSTEDRRVCAIIVAAGSSVRMGGVDKLFAELMGRPLLAWTLSAFKRCAVINDIVVVSSSNSIPRLEALVDEWRFASHVSAIIPGGDTRQESVRAGLEAASGAAIVAIHDGARPLVTSELIEQGVALAEKTGAALCAMPAHDTVKVAEGDPPLVQSTLEREMLWLAQTPQSFELSLILEAHRAAEAVATDDAALVEALGRPVTIYPGSPSNIKVTTAEDLLVADVLLRARFAQA